MHTLPHYPNFPSARPRTTGPCTWQHNACQLSPDPHSCPAKRAHLHGDTLTLARKPTREDTLQISPNCPLHCGCAPIQLGCLPQEAKAAKSQSSVAQAAKPPSCPDQQKSRPLCLHSTPPMDQQQHFSVHEAVVIPSTALSATAEMATTATITMKTTQSSPPCTSPRRASLGAPAAAAITSRCLSTRTSTQRQTTRLSWSTSSRGCLAPRRSSSLTPTAT